MHMPSIGNGWTREWEERRQARMAAGGPSAEETRVPVAVCEKCGKVTFGNDYWKIGGKNLCAKHGRAYATYLKS